MKKKVHYYLRREEVSNDFNKCIEEYLYHNLKKAISHVNLDEKDTLRLGKDIVSSYEYPFDDYILYRTVQYLDREVTWSITYLESED